jgi:gluconate 5-dehydrogenase
MIGRGRGAVVNVASVNAQLARATIAPYTATKGAVANLTKGMAADWARHGLTCNALAPGYVRTPLNEALASDPAFDAWLRQRTPAGRWGRVEELVGACVFLASDAASFVNGHVLYVDGGLSVSL